MGILNSLFSGFHKIVSGGKDVLAPVEGITFENWAKANAALASGKPIEEIISSMGIDRTRWDKVNEE